jgi:replicative DNA helicase
MNTSTSSFSYGSQTIPDKEQSLRSIESEKGLISAAFDPAREGIIKEIAGQLGADDFSEPAHQHLWRIRMQLADGGVPHDVTAVLDAARRLQLEIGGADYVLSLRRDEVLGTIGDLSLTAAAKRVKDLSLLRSFMGTLQTALDLGKTGARSHEEVLGYVADAIESARSDSAIKSTGPSHVMNFVALVAEQVQMRIEGRAPDNVTSTGLAGLDRLTGGGLADGDLVILAGRPSMGKTAFSLALAENMSGLRVAQPRHVLYFSTEQSGTALAYRMLASSSRIDASRLKRGEFAPGEFDRFVEGAHVVSDLKMQIDETSEITLPEIRARAREFAQKIDYEPMVIIVDYLQRMKSHRDADPRHVIGEISTGLKNLSKELKCPVIALAQLNRDLEKRANKRPMMSDLAESGKLEQDADVILFLYRDEYYNAESREPGITEVIVGKNRDGSVGVAKVQFEAKTQRYSDAYNPFDGSN